MRARSLRWIARALCAALFCAGGVLSEARAQLKGGQASAYETAASCAATLGVIHPLRLREVDLGALAPMPMVELTYYRAAFLNLERRHGGLEGRSEEDMAAAGRERRLALLDAYVEADANGFVVVRKPADARLRDTYAGCLAWADAQGF